MSLAIGRAFTTGLVLLELFAVRAGVAQGNPQRTTTGGRELVLLTFAKTPLGDLPAGLEMQGGNVELVDKDGQRMLRASSRATFLVRLPERLPQDFTLEFDLIPKVCCWSPEDLGFEGTAEITQDSTSANVLWHSENVRIVGGGAYYDSPLPASLAGAVPSTLTQVVVNVEGEKMKVFTNGRLIVSVNNRKFWRDTTLRVFLGGQNEGTQAVYLARLRVVANGPGNVVAGSQLAGQPGGGGPVPTIVSNVTVTQGPSGPVVNWQTGAAPGVYTVQRWKIDDLACCNNTSPASPLITGPPWQDTPPPLSGTYVYRVTVTTNGGSSSAETQFRYLAVSGTPSVSPPRAANIDSTPSRFTVTVTMGSAGPVATWPVVATATGYMVSRHKVDDLNCCNTTSGSRNYSATSPWQDQPLPMSGTYVYQVVAATPNGQLMAETQFAFRQPGGAPVNDVVPVQPPSLTAVPVTPTLDRAPTTTLTRMDNSPAPTNLSVSGGTPVSVMVYWSDAIGATRYVLSRAVAGTATWTDLDVNAPLPTLPGVRDVIPNHTQTYTYRVTAYQADGTFGAATIDFTPPAPTDPAAFTATVTGPGQVRFDWDVVPDVTTYVIAGPGAGNGVSAVAPNGAKSESERLSDAAKAISSGSRPAADRGSYTLSGIPAGTHTWTIASNWAPGGVLTLPNAWPTATATVSPAPPAQRYRLVVLGFKAEQQSTDINDARDGIADEVYFSAIVNRTSLTGVPLPVTAPGNASLIMTRSLGDEAVSVPYGRIKAGTASTTGGIRSGDLIPPSLDPKGPTGALQNLQFPMLVWEGDVDDKTAVVVHPVLWESDDNPVVQAQWAKTVFDHAAQGYQLATRTTRMITLLTGALGQTFTDVYSYLRDPYDDLGDVLFECTTILVNLVRRPCEAHGVDRPIGLTNGYSPAAWREPIILLTRVGIEQALNGSIKSYEPYLSMSRGTFVIPLIDKAGDPGTTEAIASYWLYFRVEKVP